VFAAVYKTCDDRAGMCLTVSGMCLSVRKCQVVENTSYLPMCLTVNR
jgi:hypothetical protein